MWKSVYGLLVWVQYSKDMFSASASFYSDFQSSLIGLYWWLRAIQHYFFKSVSCDCPASQAYETGSCEMFCSGILQHARIHWRNASKRFRVRKNTYFYVLRSFVATLNRISITSRATHCVHGPKIPKSIQSFVEKLVIGQEQDDFSASKRRLYFSHMFFVHIVPFRVLHDVKEIH